AAGAQTTTVSGESSTRASDENSATAPPSATGSEVPATTSSSPPEAFVTEGSGEAGTTSGNLEQTTTPPVEASGEEPVESNKVPKVEASMDENTSSATTSAVTENEATATTIDGVGHDHLITGPPFTTTEPPFDTSSFEENLRSSTLTGSTSEGSNDDEDSIINRTLIEQPHKSNLPINVGFVPGSEPDTNRESGEDEEETEKTLSLHSFLQESPKQLVYEDAVTAKGLESTIPTTSAGSASSTTEPPVQAVQDLIDAIASGGLNSIFGPPRNQVELKEEANKKLGELKKYLPKQVDQKRDCSSRRLRFVASELTDLTTKFDADAVVYSLQHCARICYETGCTLAAFTRFPRPVCLMRYNNATASECDPNAKRTTYWRFSGIQQVVRLDCIKCGMY
ncbi:hypothetical protein ANCCEY_12236, partial [Ancylostoma ceylanicum]